MDKSKLKAVNGMPLTQGLFLEIGYNTKYAVYTLKDDDYEYEGVVYPSLKKAYLELADAVEYDFATTYLLGWDHWQRMCLNKTLLKEIEVWRYELELKLRSEALKVIRAKSQTEAGINAAKWLAEKGWDKRTAGRPSKAEVESHIKKEADVINLYEADLKRVGEP